MVIKALSTQLLTTAKLVMKYIRIFLKSLTLLVLILAGYILIILAIDYYKTDYLKLNNYPDSIKNSYVINNVNIVPMTKDTILEHKSIFIKEGLIKKIAEADSLYIDGYDIINGNNMFLSPGLIDMHIHLWDRYELGLYLANGITAVRNLWGYPMHLRIKKDIENKNILGPMFFTSSPKLTSSDDPGDDKVQIKTADEAKKLVIEYKKRGFNFIKIYAGLNKELFKAITEQAKVSNIKIVSHPNRNMPYLKQFNSQVVSMEHMEEIVQEGLNFNLDTTKVKPIIQKFVATKTSFSPTLIGYYKIYEMLEQNGNGLNPDFLKYINPLIQITDSKVQYNRWKSEKTLNPSITEAIYKQHQFHLYLLKQMQKNGVNIICGTDAGIGITAPGYSLHEELNLYKEAGLSNYETLKTATINPSKTQKEFKNMGTVEEGKIANLLLTKTNPLKDIETLKFPECVMVKGHRINQNTLSLFINKAINRNGLVTTAIRYAEYLFVEK